MITIMYTRLVTRFACALMPLLLLAQPPKKITRAADVPVFQYSISGKVEDLVRSEQAFAPFAAQVRKNVESVLRDYEIDDAATKRGLLGTLAALDILEGHDDAARARLDEIKALEEKPAAKALSGLITRAILDARRESKPAFDGPTRRRPQSPNCYGNSISRSQPVPLRDCFTMWTFPFA